MKDRILLIGGGLGTGGTERALSMLANKFAEQNLIVQILTAYRTEIFYDIDNRIKITMPKLKRERTNKIIYFFYLVYFLRIEIKKSKSEIIFTLNDWINPVVVFASICLSKKVIISERTSPNRDLGIFHRIMKKVFYRFVDGAIAQTTDAQKSVARLLDISKVKVIPNPVNIIDTVSDIKQKYIISVGRLSSEKGHLILLKAFAKITDQNWTLHLVGDGPERNNLETEAEKLGVPNRVIFHGHLKNFNQLLGESEIFVLPSFYEGFPNALLEAMSVPLACISSNCVAGPSDIIEHGKNGMLVETGNVDELAAAIERLIADKELRENIAKEAYKVRETYKFDKIANQYLDFIQKTVKSR